MSTTVRNNDAQARNPPLAPRAVRIRNVCVRAIAKKRGLREPANLDLAHLQADVSLSAVVRWWEQVQRDERTSSQDDHADSFAHERSNIMIKAAAISALIVFALLAFPGELAGTGASPNPNTGVLRTSVVEGERPCRGGVCDKDE